MDHNEQKPPSLGVGRAHQPLPRFNPTEQSTPWRPESQPLGATDTTPNSWSTSRVIKQEPNINQSLIAREQLLKQAAKASVGITAARRRSEVTSMPYPAALSTQRPSAQYYKQSTPQPTLPLGPTARLNLHDVELILASLNRQINSTSEMDANRRERLMHEKNRVLGVLRQLNIENLRKKNGAVVTLANTAHLVNSTDRYTPVHPKAKNAAHLANATDRYIPAPSDPLVDVRANASNHYACMRSRDRSTDRYVPIDRYTPRPKAQGAADTTKRPREPSPEEEMEVMAEVITQVNRITKRVSGLHGRPGPQKRRKGAAEGLAVALHASVEELLARTKEVVG
ncbi:MAG: hypothetical protein Q9199_001113 [Rusavskia elegans]